MPAHNFHARKSTILSSELVCVEVWWTEPGFVGERGPCNVLVTTRGELLVGTRGTHAIGPVFPHDAFAIRVAETARDRALEMVPPE
jgi:hypothetical protein